MSLENREMGYQLSSIERTLMTMEDAGFVRYVPGSKGKAFYLDLSPFKPCSESTVYYIDDVEGPSENALIQASVESVDKRIVLDQGDYANIFIKRVARWEPLTIGGLLNRKLLSPEEFLNYFRFQYQGTDETLQAVVTCCGLFAVSNPPMEDRIGGVETGIFGKSREWTGFRYAMGFIPREFKRPSGRYYYTFADREVRIPEGPYKELNYACYNPISPIHFPMVLFEDEIMRKPGLGSGGWVKEESDVIATFMIDALISTPHIPDHLNNDIVNLVYDTVDEYNSNVRFAYNQDFDQLVPKLGLSLARLYSMGVVDLALLKRGVELWSDMVSMARMIPGLPLPSQYRTDLYRINPDIRRIYIELVDAFGIETPITMAEIASGLRQYSREKIDEALEELNKIGLVLKMPNGSVRVLDIRE